MNYTQSLQNLSDLGHELHRTKFDLDSIRKITRALDHPESKYPSAIVAGTNGKGSTSSMLASILAAAGLRTGLYTSPHLVHVNERIRVNGSMISDADFAASFSEVWDAVDRLIEQNKLAHRPSFFEFLTATAFQHFARTGINFAVLEVGMGGRLDATNIIEPRIAVITNIDLDHQQFLGYTRAAIAWEKAGVIKPGRPVISAVENPEAAGVIRARAAELGAPIVELAQAAQITDIQNLDGRYAFSLALDGDYFPALAPPLMGKFQINNTVAAVAAAASLRRDGFRISADSIEKGIRATSWPGRLEIVHDHPLVVLDGAHNPAAAREVAATARSLWPGRAIRLVYASMRDKSIEEITDILFPLAGEIYLTQPEQNRAATTEEILAAANDTARKIVIEPNPVRALERACRESSPDDVVLVAGSLYLVGAVKRALAEKHLDFESLAGHAVVSPLP